MVRLAEAVGVVLLVVAVILALRGSTSGVQAVCLAIIVIAYGFIRYCATHRWYMDAERYSGIELHFLKALVPTGYILTISLALFFIFRSAIPLAIAVFLLLFFAHVNVILIYFHRRDRDTTPANFYSGGKFLERE